MTGEAKPGRFGNAQLTMSNNDITQQTFQHCFNVAFWLI